MGPGMDAAASTLCRRCGLCCDGNLFTAVPLADDEVAAARRGGLVVIGQDGASRLRQRCAALTDGGCGVYDERPRRCRSYRCMLLVAVTEDEVGLAEALAIVDGARARLVAADAASPGAGAVLQRARGCEAPSPAVREALAYLGRHFERAAGRA